MAWPAHYDASSGFDEMIDRDGRPRAGCGDIVDRLGALGPELLDRQRGAEAAIRSMGVTFTLYSEQGNIDRSWPVDVIPRIITTGEWDRVSRALVQRLTALNLFIDDVYHDGKIIGDGVFPGELLRDSANHRDACRDVSPLGGTWAHISGSDLVRDATGAFLVLEDNLRIPSGVSYMLENRQVSKRVLADLFRDLDILPVDGYTEQLKTQLQSLSPRTGIEPVIVVLTPGVFNSAYYEHTLLATKLGAQLVEGSDLVVDEDIVYMRTVSGLVRVDVIYRRVDDLFLDPEVFRADSQLGVAGLMRAWRAGNVAVANAPGAGIADDKVVYSYVPDMIEYYLGEEPQLDNVPTWRCLEPSHLSHVVANLDQLVCKPANEAGGTGVTIGSYASVAELDALRDQITADPRNWVAQPILELSTAPTIVEGGAIEGRHLDLRPFILSGDRPYVSVGGLTRVALRKGSLIVNSSQGGGSKDTWIVDPAVRPEPPTSATTVTTDTTVT